MRPFSGDLAEAGVLQQALEVGPGFSMRVTHTYTLKPASPGALNDAHR